ncbi:MAG: hypothetical protein VXY93_17320, partial [Pseudomonadota bacterium]|nr:hypothetical protein [Pseudomonadota bacterium]
GNTKTRRFHITSGGDYLFDSGTLYVQDKIGHYNDANTNIRFPTNDTISFETSGTQRLNIAPNGNISVTNDLDVDGHTNLDNVSVAGVTTFTGAIDANSDLDVDGHTNLDNVSIAGVTTMSGNLTISNTAPTLFLTDTDHNSDFRVRVDGGLFTITDETNSADRLNINSSGVVNIPGNTNFGNGIDVTANITATGNADIDGDLDVDGHTELDNVNIVGVTT